MFAEGTSWDFFVLQWLTDDRTMLSTCCGDPVRLKTSIIVEGYTTGLQAEADMVQWLAAFDLGVTTARV